MKYVRFKVNDNSDQIYYGLLKEDKVFKLSNSYFTDHIETSDVYNVKSVRIMPPVIPSKISKKQLLVNLIVLSVPLTYIIG